MARSGRSGTGSGRIVAIIAIAIGAALVAELAVLILSPHDLGPDPVAVDVGRYFDHAQVEQASGFRAGQRNLFLIGLAIELLALGTLALGRPRRARERLERLGARPILGAAAAGAAISLLLALLAVPTGLVGHDRAVDVGLSTQDLGGWLFDRARSAAIGALLAAIGAMILIALQRRLPRLWWFAGTVIVILYAVVSTWLAPIVLAPIFNDFEPLPDGPARHQVLALADEAGVDVGGVYVVDASSRSTGLNAYVDGIGSSRRVVLYDNLLDRADAPVLRAVVAHELGHVAHDDLPRGLLFVAIVAPLGMLLVAVGGAGLARRSGSRPGTPAALPAYALLITIVSLALNLAGNQLARSVEASADHFALQLTDDPRAFIRLQQELAASNLSDPDPSSPVDAALRTHPTTVQRIGAALAYAEQHRIDPGEPTFAAPR
jgi:STE24 endopeptidase